MKYIIFILVLLAFNAKSQVKFNYSFGNLTSPNIRNVIVQDNYYYSSGNCKISNFINIVINKFDLQGNYINSKYYSGDTLEWFDGIENSLKETNTGLYIIGGNRAKNYYRDNLLIKLDNNFDTIFTKKYFPVNDGGNSDVIIYNSNIDYDGNYLLIGNTTIDNIYGIFDKTHMQLIKTDTSGNLLWRKTYGNSTYKYYGYKVVPAFGGGYILGGWCDINGGDNCLIKVDENGENPVFKYFGHPTYADGRVMEITKTKDTCYIITTSIGVTSDGLDKGYIFKLDTNLNIIWDKLYLNLKDVSGFMNAFEKPNGNLIVHGTNMNNQNRQMTVIMELTAEGDSLWKQTTTALDTVYSNNYMESGKLTPDGGMVFAGWNTNIYQSPYQQMWLVKTDSMGCDGTEWTCDINYLEEFASKEDNGLLLYPNPVKNELNISFNQNELIKNSTVIASRRGGEAIPSYKQIASSTAFPRNDELTKQQFQELPIQEKLAYNVKHPKQNYWTEKEEQEMRELSRQFAYAFPFEVIKGKVDIFSIDPALNAIVIANNNVIARKNDEAISLNKQINSVEGYAVATSQAPRNDVQIVTIYDIFGREVSRVFLLDNNTTIDVSNLQNGVYFVKVGNSVAKFIKE